MKKLSPFRYFKTSPEVIRNKRSAVPTGWRSADETRTQPDRRKGLSRIEREYEASDQRQARVSGIADTFAPLTRSVLLAPSAPTAG